MNKYTALFFSCGLTFLSCNAQSDAQVKTTTETSIVQADKGTAAFDTTLQTIHLYVALCDNKYQGIVPVSAKIGNGQDPDNNLYWGCGYGIRTYPTIP